MSRSPRLPGVSDAEKAARLEAVFSDVMATLLAEPPKPYARGPRAVVEAHAEEVRKALADEWSATRIAHALVSAAAKDGHTYSVDAVRVAITRLVKRAQKRPRRAQAPVHSPTQRPAIAPPKPTPHSNGSSKTSTPAFSEPTP
jgi:hypothetical protein